jgi:hypothetical protein
VPDAGERPSSIRVSCLRDHRADDSFRPTVVRVRVVGQQMVYVLDTVCRRVDGAAVVR